MEFKLFLAVAVLAIGICIWSPVSAQIAPEEQDRNRTGETTLKHEKLTFECPKDVRIGFKNTPEGWKEGWGGGIGLSVPFAEAMVDGSSGTIGCYYRNEADPLMNFQLFKKVPPGYKCAVDKINDNDKYNRFFTCTLIGDKVVPLKKN